MDEGKRFSLEKADGLIPHMELVVEKMQRIGMRVRAEMGTLSAEQCSPVRSQHVLQLRPALRPLFEDMAQAVQQIEQLGGLFKGLELGLVDFPACVEGEDVYLCWQYGEKEIAFYHKRDEGFADRRTIGARIRKPQYEQ